MSENHSAPTRRLPEQPNLEQLRNQAKELLEQYRAGNPAAVAEVRRFERNPGASLFALHDAQRVLDNRERQRHRPQSHPKATFPSLFFYPVLPPARGG
jgi:hypothetical protein